MTDRQALFSGTEAPPQHLTLDARTLGAWLDAHIGGFGPSPTVEKFKGGQSNPTYLIIGERRQCVLRRKPPGKLLPSAHAIDREYRVLEALHSSQVPVPHPYLYCADETLIGSEFYLVEHVPGRVFGDADLPASNPDERRAIYDGMNAVLAALHTLDPVALRLGDIGRTDGYTARNLARWSDIYRKSLLVDLPDMDWLMTRLAEELPATEPVALIHGDYGLYNIIVDKESPTLRAVLDWEMSTLGNPFVDLAHHLRAWWDLPDPHGAATSLAGLDLEALGIPDMHQYIATYCASRGIAVPDMRWYLAYAQFRYAAMIQGILARARAGTASSRTVLHRQERVVEIAALARRTLTGAP